MAIDPALDRAVAEGLADASAVPNIGPVNWRRQCAQMRTTEGLDAYRIRLSALGCLSSDAMAAIRERMDHLRGGRG